MGEIYSDDEVQELFDQIEQLEFDLDYEVNYNRDRYIQKKLSLFGLKPYETYTLGEVEAIKKAIQEALT